MTENLDIAVLYHYYGLILDHSKTPKNKKTPLASTNQSIGEHLVCGDSIKIFLEVKDLLIDEIFFDGTGCATCIASASLMTEHVKGLNIDQALDLFDDFQSLVTIDLANKNLGNLQAFAEVKDYPIRVKCATLPWHVLKAALGKNPSVSI